MASHTLLLTGTRKGIGRALSERLARAISPPGSEGKRGYLSLLPMNRFGKRDEIAAAIAFLMSEDAGFITGQTLSVDGGASIGKGPV